MLGARVVDAVLVGGAPERRASLTVSALGAGLPVLLEPPMASSLEEAEWIGEAERAVRLPVMVGFHRWWWQPVERLRLALAQSPEGELAVESTVDLDPDDSDPFVALAAHLDLVRRLSDREIASVSGHRESLREVQAHLTFHGGGQARCLVRSADQPHERVTVRAGRRTYEMRSGSGRIRPASGPGRRALDFMDSVLNRMLGRRGGVDRSYEGMLRAFVQQVETRAFAGPGTSVGIAVLLATMAVRRSLEQGGTEMIVPAGLDPGPEAS